MPLLNHQQKLKELYDAWQTVISPLVTQYEIMEAKFPVQILNELRAFTTHIARCYDPSINDAKIKRELNSAKRHIQRARLDCFKLLCDAYENEYKRFTQKYVNVDLTLIDNGDFSSRSSILLKECRDKALQANISEQKGNTIEDTFKKYETAFVAYNNLHDLLNSSMSKCVKLQHRMNRSIFWYRVSLFLSITVSILALYDKFVPYITKLANYISAFF